MSSDLEDAHEKADGLRLSLESAYKEMTELKRGLMEKEDAAREEQLQREIEARERLERQAREDQVRSLLRLVCFSGFDKRLSRIHCS
jgi:hypothetical protein